MIKGSCLCKGYQFEVDGDPGSRTSAHYFVASKAPWVEISDDATQYDEYPTG